MGHARVCSAFIIYTPNRAHSYFQHCRHAQSPVSIHVYGTWTRCQLSSRGVNSAPSLRGASDGNSRKGPILPVRLTFAIARSHVTKLWHRQWLRALDGLNTHDEAYRLSASGGVTVSIGSLFDPRLSTLNCEYICRPRSYSPAPPTP